MASKLSARSSNLLAVCLPMLQFTAGMTEMSNARLRSWLVALVVQCSGNLFKKFPLQPNVIAEIAEALIDILADIQNE